MTAKNIALAFIALFLLLPQMADAHRLNVFAWLENDRIIVECNFGEKRPARNAKVSVFDSADNALLDSGMTNNEGQFVFDVPTAIANGHGLIIVVNAGDGHQNEWRMEASELYAAASLTAGFAEAKLQEEKTAKPSSIATHLPPLSANYLTREEAKSLLESSLGPIRQELAKLNNKAPSLSDIIGGLGWIMGLVGIALYFKSKK